MRVTGAGDGGGTDGWTCVAACLCIYACGVWTGWWDASVRMWDWIESTLNLKGSIDRSPADGARRGDTPRRPAAVADGRLLPLRLLRLLFQIDPRSDQTQAIQPKTDTGLLSSDSIWGAQSSVCWGVASPNFQLTRLLGDTGTAHRSKKCTVHQ